MRVTILTFIVSSFFSGAIFAQNNLPANCSIPISASLWESHAWYGSMVQSFPDQTAKFISVAPSYGSFCGTVENKTTMHREFLVENSNYHKISFLSDGAYTIKLVNLELDTNQVWSTNHQLLTNVTYLQRGSYRMEIVSHINPGASGLLFSIQTTDGIVIKNSH